LFRQLSEVVILPYGGAHTRRGRRLSETSGVEAAEGGELAGFTSGPSATSLSTKLARRKLEELVEGEAPAALVSGGIIVMVQRGLYTDAADRSLSVAEVEHPGAVLPLQLYHIGQNELLDVAITDFSKVPWDTPRAPRGFSRPRVASYSKQITTYLSRQPMNASVLNNTSDNVSRFVLWTQRTTGLYLSGCIRDSQCSGPAGYDPPVSGQCIDARCHCPLPWTGYTCNRKLDCLNHDRLLGYGKAGGEQNSTRCELDLNKTSLFPGFLACSCPLIGTYNMLGVEQAQVALKGKGVVSINLISLPEDFAYISWENLRRGWLCSIMLLSTIVLQLLCLIAVCIRGNEKEVRRQAKYYAFWREQQKARIAEAAKIQQKVTLKKWCEATATQMKAQHKLLRVFFFKVDATLVDPAAAPNGFQKVTVIFAIVWAKYFFASMLYDPVSAELYEKESMFQKLIRQVLTGMIISSLALPITVFLDRMYNIQQKIVHGKVVHGAEMAPGEHGAMALQSIKMVFDTAETRRAFMAWVMNAQLYEVDRVRARLLEMRTTRRSSGSSLTIADQQTSTQRRTSTERWAEISKWSHVTASNQAAVNAWARKFNDKLSPALSEVHVRQTANDTADRLADNLAHAEALFFAADQFKHIMRNVNLPAGSVVTKENVSRAIVMRAHIVIAWALCGYITRRRARNLGYINRYAVRELLGGGIGNTFYEMAQAWRCLTHWAEIVQGLKDGTIDAEQLANAALQIQRLRRGVLGRRSSKRGSVDTSKRGSVDRAASSKRGSVEMRSQRGSVAAARRSSEEAGSASSMRGASTRHNSTTGVEARSPAGRDGWAVRSSASVVPHPGILPSPDKQSSSFDHGPRPPTPDALQVLSAVWGVLSSTSGWMFWRKDNQPRRAIRSCYDSMCASVLFWRIWPWAVSYGGLACVMVLTLIYQMKFFAFNNDLFRMWLEGVATSLGLSWFVSLPTIIIFRNNVKFTKKIMKTKRYQIFEKYVGIPLMNFINRVYRAIAF